MGKECVRLKIGAGGRKNAQTGFPAALKCVVFVGLHLAVRLIPSPLKMKMGEGAVNPHKNIYFFFEAVKLRV